MNFQHNKDTTGQHTIGPITKEGILADCERHQQAFSQPPEPAPYQAEQQPKSDKIPKVPPFPVEVFPALLQEVVTQTSHHLQYRTDWIGSAILYAASVAIGNAVGTKYNDWKQKPTLYLALVGMPGTNKSGPPEYALTPIRKLNAETYKAYKLKKDEYDQWADLTKKERKAAELPDQMPAPTYQTLLVNDVTPEGLAITHQNNPIGLGLFMNELAGWFQNFNRYQKGSEQEFWLSNWSFSPVSIVRKTSLPVLINQPSISIAGTIQPGVLGELAKDRRNQNGFIDRILFTYPDDQQTPYDAETQLNPAITANYTSALDRLLKRRNEVGFDSDGNPDTTYIPFAPDAVVALRTWKN